VLSYFIEERHQRVQGLGHQGTLPYMSYVHMYICMRVYTKGHRYRHQLVLCLSLSTLSLSQKIRMHWPTLLKRWSRETLPQYLTVAKLNTGSVHTSNRLVFDTIRDGDSKLTPTLLPTTPEHSKYSVRSHVPRMLCVYRTQPPDLH
jgi:hypothetical protein